MKANRTSTLSNVMSLAWQFVKRNGYNISEALKAAWRNVKLVAAMHVKIVQFFFTKVDGTIRQAFGTLEGDKLPEGKGSGRKPNDSVQVYFDTEKGEFRCFKKCNLVRIVL